MKNITHDGEIEHKFDSNSEKNAENNPGDNQNPKQLNLFNDSRNFTSKHTLSSLLKRKIPLQFVIDESSRRRFLFLLKKTLFGRIIELNGLEFSDLSTLKQHMNIFTENDELNIEYQNGPLHFLDNHKNDKSSNLSEQNTKDGEINQQETFIIIENPNTQLFQYLTPYLPFYNFIFLSKNTFCPYKKVFNIFVKDTVAELEILTEINNFYNVLPENFKILEQEIKNLLYDEEIELTDIFLADKSVQSCFDTPIDNFLIEIKKVASKKVPSKLESRIQMYLLLSLCYATHFLPLRREINQFLRSSLTITQQEIEKYLYADSLESLCHKLSLVPTEQTQILIQDVLSSYKLCNSSSGSRKCWPILLQGPTGTGKTTIVQKLITNLQVLNCSRDTDIADFMGNYGWSTNNEQDRDKNIEKTTESPVFQYIPGPFLNAILNNQPFLFDEMNLLGNDVLEFLSSLFERGKVYSPQYFHKESSEKSSEIPINTPVFININREGKKNITFPVIRITVNEISSDLNSIKQVVQSVFLTKSSNLKTSAFPDLDTLAHFYHQNRSVSFRTLLRMRINSSHLAVYSLTGLSVDNYNIEYDFDNYQHLFPVEDVSNPILQRNSLDSKNSSQSDSLQSISQQNLSNFIITKNTKSLLLQMHFLIENSFPVILMGDTSTGKTTILKYLAKKRGIELIRVNNHRDTDKSDYIGQNIIVHSDKKQFNDKLEDSEQNQRLRKKDKFHTKWQDGPLITAIKKDCWFLVDEINLCSTDTLEILNRLLDDNREIHYNNTIIRPGPNFRIFGTMNQGYQGRYTLSDAFMDRWVCKEVTVELEEIVSEMIVKNTDKRTNQIEISQDIAKNAVNSQQITRFLLSVYNHLSLLRNFKSLFTLRDFFKILSRYGTDFSSKSDEISLIKKVVKDYLINRQRDTKHREMIGDIITEKWDATLGKDLGQKKEIKETKPSYVKILEQIFSGSEFANELNDHDFHKLLDEHLNLTEKEHENVKDLLFFFQGHNMLSSLVLTLNQMNFIPTFSQLSTIRLIIISFLNRENVLLVGETGIGKTRISEVISVLIKRELVTVCCHGSMDTSDLIGQYVVSDDETSNPKECQNQKIDIKFRHSLLVSALNKESVILLDEINLPSASVIERLNSLFDSHELFICENNELIESKAFIIATMNPGTYAGKKELSEALRNRFTEIFVQFNEYEAVYDRIIGNVMEYLIKEENFFVKSDNITDNSTHLKSNTNLLKNLKDKILSNTSLSIRKLERLREFLLNLSNSTEKIVKRNKTTLDEIVQDGLEIAGIVSIERKNCVKINSGKHIGFEPYWIEVADEKFTDLSPTNSTDENVNSHLCQVIHSFTPLKTSYTLTTHNCALFLRALFTSKNILLEGPPGIGKTSIIQIIGKMLGLHVERINLSECTEFSELIGGWVPVGNSQPENQSEQNTSSNELNFKFIPSAFIEAIKTGAIVILDEINLCTQSVLEGLNSLLDYRGFITVNNQQIQSKAIIIGTMNPVSEKGGVSYKGRKILPKSFLDRFTRVTFESYDNEEAKNILSSNHQENSNIEPTSLLSKILSKYGELSLRQCIRAKLLGLNSISHEIVKYEIEDNQIQVGDTKIIFNDPEKYKDIESVNISRNIDQNKMPKNSNFVLLAPRAYEHVLNTLYHNIPLIVVGTGAKAHIRKASEDLGMPVNNIFLHGGMDITGLIGQWRKIDHTDQIDTRSTKNLDNKPVFKWQPSDLLKSLKPFTVTVVHAALNVSKSVLDALIPLLDTQSLNVLEKGEDTLLKFSNARICFVLESDEMLKFSEPFIDRCEIVRIGPWNGVELAKVLSNYTAEQSKVKEFEVERENIAEKLSNEEFPKSVKRVKISNQELKNIKTNAHDLQKDLSEKLLNEIDDKMLNSYYEIFDRIAIFSRLLLFLSKFKFSQDKIRDLWLKMRVYDPLQIFLGCLDKNEILKEQSEKILPKILQRSSESKFPLFLPHLATQTQLQSFFTYPVLKLTKSEKNAIKIFNSYEPIEKSLLGLVKRMKDEEFELIAKRLGNNKKLLDFTSETKYDSKTLREFLLVAQFLQFLDAKNLKDFKRKIITDKELKQDLMDKWEEEINYICNFEEFEGINEKQLIDKDEMSLDLLFQTIARLPDLKPTNLPSFDYLRQILYKSVICLPNCTTGLIKMYKYGKASDSAQKFLDAWQNNLLNKFRSSFQGQNCQISYNQMFKIPNCFYITVDFTRKLTENKKYQKMESIKRKLISEWIKHSPKKSNHENCAKDSQLIDDLQKRTDKLAIKERKIPKSFTLTDCLLSIKRKDKKIKTHAFGQLVFFTFFGNMAVKDVLLAFIEEQVSNGYDVPDWCLNSLVKNVMKVSADLSFIRKSFSDRDLTANSLLRSTKPVLNYQIFLHLITTKWSLPKIEAFALVYDFLHFLNTIYFIREICLNEKICDLLKKNKKSEEENNLKDSGADTIQSDESLSILYNFSLQYYSFFSIQSLRLENSKANATDCIDSVEGILRKCYNECQKCVEVLEILQVNEVEEQKCACLVLFDLKTFKNPNLKFDHTQFYSRPIKDAYNSSDLALGRLMFKYFSVYKGQELPSDPILSHLLVLAQEMTVTPLLGNIWSRIEETERSVESGRMGGKGDIKDQGETENDQKDEKEENEHVEEDEMGAEGVNEDFDGENEENDGKLYDKTQENKEKEEIDEQKDEIEEESKETEPFAEQADEIDQAAQNENQEDGPQDEIKDEKYDFEQNNSDLDGESVDENSSEQEPGEDLSGEELSERNEDDAVSSNCSDLAGSSALTDSNLSDESNPEENIPEETSSDNLEENSAEDLEENSADNLEETSSENLEKTSSDDLEDLSAQPPMSFRSFDDENVPNTDQTCESAQNYDTGGLEEESGPATGTKAQEENAETTAFDSVENTNDQNPEPKPIQNDLSNLVKDAMDTSSDHSLLVRLESILFSNKKYEGDYKTGKKLNMKKIIEFIGSSYQKDKIWLRKKPSTPFIIRLFIDNTESMKSYDLPQMIQIFLRLKWCLKMLNIQTEIYKFGTEYVKFDEQNLTFETNQSKTEKFSTDNSQLNVQNTSQSQPTSLLNFLTLTDTFTNYNFLSDFHTGINIVLTDGIVNQTVSRNENFLFLIFNKEILKLESIEYKDDKIVRVPYIKGFVNKYEIVDGEIQESVLSAIEEMVNVV